VLVDLDRAAVRAPIGERERDAMLVRMARYVTRHRRQLAAVPTRTEMLRFLRALGFDRQGRAAAWARLCAKLRRALARRRWLRRGG
jgi:hypothetical protein